MSWRVGTHYGIHVYEGDRPVATFLTEEDARRCVEAIAASEAPRPLYVNHDRAEPVPGDVVQDADTGCGLFFWVEFATEDARWVMTNGRTKKRHEIAPNLRLLVDGTTGQVVR